MTECQGSGRLKGRLGLDPEGLFDLSPQLNRLRPMEWAAHSIGQAFNGAGRAHRGLWGLLKALSDAEGERASAELNECPDSGNSALLRRARDKKAKLLTCIE